jgi:hypothetical protein
MFWLGYLIRSLKMFIGPQSEIRLAILTI